MDFNIAPYFDDFDELNKYYKILFRPGVAVQTRELNQLQSILQNQITKFGDHVFREGSMVIPGQVNYNDKLNYLKLSAISLGGQDLSYLEDKIISSNSDGTGIRAQVIKTIAATDTTPITLVLLYVGSNETPNGDTGKVFSANSTLYLSDDSTKTVTVAGGSNVSGRSVAAGIQAGVYYLAGHFVTVDAAILSVKTYADDTADINARIGIKYTESVITSDTDSSLNDNAAGSPNYAAPGAHRYKITTEFIQVGLDESPENFFELLRVEEGTLQSIVNASQYNILEETLARRTYDESGNYVVEDFVFNIRESRKNDRGTWTSGSYQVNDFVKSSGDDYFVCLQSGTTGANEPAEFTATTTDQSVVITDGSVKWRYTNNPEGNDGYTLSGNSSNLVATFGLGKAYVQGYEIDKTSNSNITIPKSRDIRSQNNSIVYTPVGNYMYADRRFMFGVPDCSSSPVAFLFDRTIGSRTSEVEKFGHGQQVGTARISWSEPDSRGGVRLGLSDIKMVSDYSFDRDVNSIVVPSATTSVATTSYAATGSIKYAGNNTSSYLAINGTIGTSSQGSTAMIVSGTNTVFTAEFAVGDLITLGTSSHAVTSSWTISSIVSDTTMILTGSPLSGNASTSALVRVPKQTLMGNATGTAVTFLQQEFRVGDTIYMGAANSSTTGTVIGFTSGNRMLVSSALNAIIANTSFGTYYAGRVGVFAADAWSNYGLGINARKLSGQYSLTNVTGAAVTIGTHAGIRLGGTADAKMLTELLPNDLIEVNGNRIYVTRVSSNTVAFGVCLDASIAGSTTTYPAFRINNSLNDTQNNTLLFPTNTVVQSLADNVYTVYKVQSISGVLNLSSISVSLAAANAPLNAAAEALATTDVNAFYVAQDASSTLSAPININSVTLSGTAVIISLASTLSANTVKVVYPVQRASDAANSLGNLRTKTLNFGASKEFLSSSSAVKNTLVLSNTDIYRVVKVYMATSFVGTWNAAVQSAAIDITNRYQLDDGQRDTFYDLGRLNLIPGQPLPTGSVKVFFDYFSHGNGDFFAKASYSELTVPYENIPSYKGYNLADVLDFRGDIVESSGNISSSAPPRFGTNFTTDISFYLSRKERIFLDRNGTFYSVAGVSDIKSEYPVIAENNNSINLYDVALTPYTSSSEYPDVLIKKYDNRRYTMKDIGRIEKRVSNLEEITSLSLLETATKGLQVRDNLDSTLERYKTGFFVDNFRDASNAEEGGDARYTIDFNNGTMQSMVEYYRFPLVEKINYTVSATTAGELNPVIAARATDRYKVTGDLLTLNFTTSNLLQQVMATTSISVAPFLTATFFGKMRIIPDKDIYENVNTVKVVSEQFTNTQAQAVAAYKATRNWRPYTVSVNTTTTFLGETTTSQLIPYCRANTILLIAKCLKPNTRYYTFFDDVPVERFITGATKFTFDSVPVLDFTNSRASNKDDYPRWRSLYESFDDSVRSRVKRGKKWVYQNTWVRKTVNPKDNDLTLPGKATRDTFKAALGIGSSVWYYERKRNRNTVVGTGVAVHQKGTTLYVVNGRGKLSNTFIRQQTSNYNFYDNGRSFFYVAVDEKEPKYITSPKGSADICSQDTSGYMYSDDEGTIVALLDLPETDAIKFITGKKPVVFTDDPENHPDNWTSKAEAIYEVQGFNVTITKNYLSTKTFVARPYDPVAQSFKLPSQFTNGVFVTDVDIYFQGKPTVERAPVQLEIRACDSTGRPSGTEIIPGTEVIKYPEDILIDATAQTATKFEFKQPVYLMPEKNYAIVLKSDTKNYRIWIATLGQFDVFKTSSSYSTQATLGSFFKSQDGTLWTEDQFSDMKYRINRAVFDTVDTGATAYFVNQELANVNLVSNPLTFVHGSNRVRVTHKNHGFSSGDTTRLYSPYWAAQYALDNTRTIQGIPVGELFGAYTSSDTTDYRAAATDPKLIVSRVTLDSYEVTVSSTAYIAATATTGVTAITDGGADIVGHGNVLYHVIKPSASIMNFQPTTMTMTGKLLRGFTYDGAAPSTPYTHFNKELNFNTNNILDTSCIVLTDTNEYDRVSALTILSGGVSTAWKDSFVGAITMKTTDNAVSPVVDISTFNLDLIQHRIDNPTAASRLGATLPGVGTTSQVMLITTVATSNTTISFDGSNKAINTTTEGLFDNVIPGRYISVSGSTVSGNTFQTTAVLVTAVANNGKTIYVSANSITSAVAGDSIFIHQYDDFTEEATLSDASGESKFIIRKINLENPATQIKVILESCVPSAADFDVYYKIGAVGTEFETLTWKKFVAPFQTTAGATSSYVAIAKSDERGKYTDIEFNISNFDAQQNAIDLEPFTAFQIKVVMRSSNAARIPQFRNLRVIAHA